MQTFKKQNNTLIFWLLSVAGIAYGIFHASSLAYVNDDAFISFRYAKNFINGLGLVYNTGERVEGYTNFLWTMFIAFGMKFHADPVSFSIISGIVCYALTIVLFIFLSWKLSTYQQISLLIPLTALALSVHRDFNVYATSGLETSLFTLLLAGAYTTLLIGKTSVSHFLSGVFLTLAMMTRPDGIIFYGISMLYVLLIYREFRLIFALLLPGILLYLPYWIWRYDYYGYFYPNTFYAKSVDSAYYTQGLKYVWLYFETYYALLLIIPLAAWVIIRQRKNIFPIRAILARLYKHNPQPHPVLLGLMLTIPYIVFTIYIGGDFMFARFLVPITPVLFFTVESLINTSTNKFQYTIIALMIVVATAFRYDHFTNTNAVEYIADEHQVYTAEHLEQARSKGKTLNTIFANLPVKIAFWGGQARLVYYIDPILAIEANAGLTDSYIAHLPLADRGRPGHEKQAPKSYLLEREVSFMFGTYTDLKGTIFLDKIYFNDIPAKIVVYKNSIMSELAKNPDVKFIPFPLFLDDYISKISSLSKEQVQRDYANFKSYYFNHNDDPDREKSFTSFLDN